MIYQTKEVKRKQTTTLVVAFIVGLIVSAMIGVMMAAIGGITIFPAVAICTGFYASVMLLIGLIMAASK